jgi:hypothetical protein
VFEAVLIGDYSNHRHWSTSTEAEQSRRAVVCSFVDRGVLHCKDIETWEEESMSISVSFSDGGVWMYVIVAWGIALYGGVLAQLVLSRRNDFSQVLWGGVAALLLIGVLGSVIGFIEGMGAVADAPTDQVSTLAARVMAIAPLPTALAAVIAVPGATLTGIAASTARKHARRREA